jgi:hypothetical protein
MKKMAILCRRKSSEFCLSPNMAVTQTVILREHNRIAVDLNDLNPHLSDERLRHMLIGQSHLKQISSSPSLPIENAGARPFAPSKRFHVG